MTTLEKLKQEAKEKYQNDFGVDDEWQELFDGHLISYIDEIVTTTYQQAFKDGMEHREFLICPCGCTMRIDAEDYQEHHSATRFDQPNQTP